ncbi:osmoprotectant transport system substrate-binding protein [Modicisalibacter ilicicola DSM 19980]|uniref:Osmoprotectant transport system substrate-binding protein n=1 Tax=Modicisalibacter ilicicola DSM 19980 TaxID=1121942 RepID=A0A1M5B5T5_9GAMM|nr:ABC transporter substrate-binding protein [Halomonas ilicicola]SHF37911.1 osmoprotectant transport system substrate-binding protein [Halomonas ilicicola DSM 19980]
MIRFANLVGIALGTALTMSQAAAAEPIRVASKIDTEGALLGNMMIALLENADYPVENKLQLGPTNIVRTALLENEIDMYPEYTGNGAFFTGTTDDPAWKDLEKGFDKIRQADLEENNVVWLQPAPANNTWAIAVRQNLAEEHGLETMEDFGEWIGNGGEVKLAASAEFVDSEAALPSFQQTYDFELSQDQLLVLSGGNTAATIRAAAEGTSGTNAAMVYGTDGAIQPAGLRVMDDTQGVQMVYAPAVVVRQPVLEANPELEELFLPVFDSLDRETLQKLNGRIQVEGQPARQVAQDYLKENGFLE